MPVNPQPFISMVAAMDRNQLIGASGELPWRLPDDMAYFKKVTMGKPVIMGRKTYESIPPRFRPLVGRHNIILTRNQDYQAQGCTIVHSIAAALTAAGAAPELAIGGGANLYEQFLPFASRLYLTLVHVELDGDVYFPKFKRQEWCEVDRLEHAADARHPYSFTWLTLDRHSP